MKYCVKGNHEVERSEFGPSKRAKDGLLGSCRLCINKYYRIKSKHYASRKVGVSKRDKFQIAAFMAMYKAARIGGIGGYQSFASAICGSSDDVFRRLPEGSVDRYFSFQQENKRARVEISNHPPREYESVK